MAKQKIGPNQRKWLKALESGKFRQTKEVLRTQDGGFCCLGVACEVFKTKATTVVLDGNRFSYDGNTGPAPDYVVDTLLLIGDCGERKDGADPCLTKLNDDGKRFKTIAKIIRDDPAKYFEAPA